MKYLLTIVIAFTLIQSFSYAQNQYLPPADSGYIIVFEDTFGGTSPYVDSDKWSRGLSPWPQSGTNLIKRYPCYGDTAILDRAYVINDTTDTTCIKVSAGTCKLFTNKRPPPFHPGEVWNWPFCASCGTFPTISETGTPCHDTCKNTIIKKDSPACHCWTIDFMPFKYTTGMLYSKDRFKFGYFEMQYRVPIGGPTTQGLGPNFWLWNSDDTRKNYWSEIDIFEMDAYNPAPSHSWAPRNGHYSTVHYSNIDSTAHPTILGAFDSLPPDTLFHKAAAWWTPESIKFYFDDVLKFTVMNSDSIPLDSLIEMPIFIDVNVSLGCIPYDSLSTVFPYIYEIDYVRVYQLKDYCNTDTLYCSTTKADFQSGLYHQLTIDGIGCNSVFDSGANITGVGSDFVLLDEGFTVDGTSKAYFDVQPCSIHFKFYYSPIAPPLPPPDAWLRKNHIDNY